MRNMIALRKLFQVFGRGTLKFLNPANRKVLAYLRCYRDEQILCVANLSRFAQPVDLELPDMEGMTPVEMLGYVQFPRIERQPYRLTLSPYAFFWLELHGQAESVANVETEMSIMVVDSWRSCWRGLGEIVWRPSSYRSICPGSAGLARRRGASKRRALWTGPVFPAPKLF